MLSNKNHNPVVTELFARGRKINIYLVFIMRSRLALPKHIRLILTPYFIMILPNKQELQQIAFDYSLDIEFQDVKNLGK